MRVRKNQYRNLSSQVWAQACSSPNFEMKIKYWHGGEK